MRVCECLYMYVVLMNYIFHYNKKNIIIINILKHWRNVIRKFIFNFRFVLSCVVIQNRLRLKTFLL